MVNSYDGYSLILFLIEIKSYPILFPSFNLVFDQNCWTLFILSPLKIARFLHGEFL